MTISVAVLLIGSIQPLRELSGGTRDEERLGIKDLGEGGHQRVASVTQHQQVATTFLES